MALSGIPGFVFLFRSGSGPVAGKLDVPSVWWDRNLPVGGPRAFLLPSRRLKCYPCGGTVLFRGKTFLRAGVLWFENLATGGFPVVPFPPGSWSSE